MNLLLAAAALLYSSSSCNFSSLPLLHTHLHMYAYMHSFVINCTWNLTCHSVAVFILTNTARKIMRKGKNASYYRVTMCASLTQMFAYHTLANISRNCCFYRNHTLIVIKIHFHIFLLFFHTLFWCFFSTWEMLERSKAVLLLWLQLLLLEIIKKFLRDKLINFALSHANDLARNN